MASDTDRVRSALRDVRTPSRLFDPVEEVLDSLNQKVLWESAKLAKARVASGEICTVDRGDLLSAVHLVLAQAASEIEKALGSDASEVVKKRAS